MHKKQNIYYVYSHIRLDNNKIFYIGKGKLNRSHSKQYRNKYWWNIVKKHGYKINIIKNNLYENNAIKLEIDLIKKLKEKKYKLANITNGGDGTSGYKFTKEQKENLLKIRKNLFKNKVHYMVGRCKEKSPRYGKKASLETRIKLSKANKGKFLGRKHPNALKIKYNNIFFGCLFELAKYENMSYSGIKKRIKNNIKWGYEIL